MSAGTGRFIWFDLATTDIPAARTFYTDIVGWKSSKWPGAAEYEMFGVGDDQVGGLMSLGPDAQRTGMRAQWIGYVGVQDVDASVRRAEKLGGKILRPGTDIPEVGRYAMLADPQGASFGIFQPNRPSRDMDTSRPGHFGWVELNTTDWKSAWRFYGELFAWQKTDSLDMGPELGEYFMFGTEPKRSMGGMSDAARLRMMPPHWLFYVRVANVDESVKAIPQKGGVVLNGPMDVPGGDRVLQGRDPQGVLFALFSSAKR